jgi:DNA-binding response OmpR family regulator
MSDKTKVLIIDDDPAICESVKAVLDANGFAAETALSGMEGLEAFGRVKPDAVLCDMMMEDVDSGFRVAKIMRGKRADVPIYLLSTIGDATAGALDLGGLGFNGVFQKPVDFDLLLASLRRLKA